MLDWTKQNEFRVGEATFRLALGRLSPDDAAGRRFIDDANANDPQPDHPYLRSSAELMMVWKPKWMVKAYARLAQQLRPRNIFELGIYTGGSTAYLAHLTRPDRLVAVDINPEPVTVLHEHLQAFALDDVVSTHYGVDQADHERLTQIVDNEYSGVPIDLVIDDASHRLEETRSTFHTLFPRLRPGGVYVIEDWSWAHIEGFWPGDTPLTALALELVLASGSQPAVIAQLDIRFGLMHVTRGPAAIDPGTFELSTCYDHRVGELIAWPQKEHDGPQPRQVAEPTDVGDVTR